MNTIDSQDRELAILENIYHIRESKPIRQRDLAQIVGISLGMTNVIIGKLVQKGLIAIRKINSRNIQYAVTPHGIEEIARRSYRLLKRTVRNVVAYKDILDALIEKAKAKGVSGIMLVGKSDFDFILSHLCQKHGMSYGQSDTSVTGAGRLIVHSEVVHGHSQKEGEVSLRDILIGL